MSDHALVLHGVSKSYPGFALENVSFTLPRGHVMGLIGRNGAGKTTLVKLVMGLVSPSGGTIEALGLDNRRHGVAVRSRIGFVYDEPSFPHHVNARDIGRAVEPFYAGWDPARYSALLAEFKVPAGTAFKKLSGGMRMKLSLAVALSHDAELLLLDEPTAGLDLGFRRELLDHLLGVLQDERRSVLFSTHVTSDLERIADFITLIRSGRVAFSLPKDELREGWGIVRGDAALLSRLAGLPVRGVRRSAYGIEALVGDAAAARQRLQGGEIVDRASLDDVMVLMGQGGGDVEAA